MRDISRSQLAIYAAAAIALVLIGANYLTGHPSAPASAPGAPAAPGARGHPGAKPPALQAVAAGGGAAPARPAPAAGTAGGAAPAGAGPAGGPAVVHVLGAVRHPGVYQFPPTARVQDAVRRAGGPTGKANLTGINLAARVADGTQVVVPEKGTGGAIGAPSAAGAGAVATKGAKKGAKGAGSPAAPVNINS